MSKTYTNTVFRFEWTCTEANRPGSLKIMAQYRLDCYPAGADPIAVDSAHIVNCNYAAIKELKCKWDYDDDLPLGLGTQANMEIEFDDELLPVDMSNMLTDEPVDVTVPMKFTGETGWNGDADFDINVSDQEDYDEYIQNFTSDLTIKAGNIFILSVYDKTITGDWRTLAAGMQKNSDTYEWDIQERKQSIKVTNLGRVVFETIKTRWMRWLPVYCDAIERHMTYIDYLYAAENKNILDVITKYIYVGGTVAASTEVGNGLVSFLFCPSYKVEEFMLIMAKKIAQYYTRMAVQPLATNLTLYNNQYYKQTYDDCTGARGDSIGVPYTYMIAAVNSPYIEVSPTYFLHPHFMYGGVCGEMENRYPSAWDYLSDSAKNRFVRELLKFDFTYPTDAQIALGVINPSLAFEIKDSYIVGTYESKTFKQSANMIYEPTLKVRDNVFTRVTAAAPDLCTQDISSVTARNPSSLSTREFNMPIIFNNLPGADENGFTGGLQYQRNDVHTQRFHINHLNKAFVRYSWATYHGWQQFYKDEPTCGLYGALTNNNDEVFIRVHEKMDFMIDASIASTTFYEPPDMDFSMVTTKIMDQTNYIYVQNNSGEPLIKANVFLKLFGSGRQSTLGGITRLNTFDWFDQTRAGIRVDFTEIAPAGNPSKFSELANYFALTCAEIDVKAGYVEFKAYGLNYDNQ